MIWLFLALGAAVIIADEYTNNGEFRNNIDSLEE